MKNVLNKKTTATALYARVSSEEQSKYGFSVQNQIERMKKYAEENNLAIVDIYVDEGFSAGSKKRPELQRMLNDLHRFDLIIFTKLDRFTRNVLDANEMVNEFNRVGVSIKAVEEDDVDTSTADGMFMFNLKVSLAQRELAKGSERVKTVFEYKVKKGQPITGSLPIGYKIEVGQNGEKQVVIDKEYEPFVREFYDHFKQYHSIRAAGLYVNEKHNQDRSYSFFSRLLTNELYCGTFRGNTDFCTGYVSREEWNEMQQLKKRHIKTTPTNNVYLFSALMDCPVCQRRLTVNCCFKNMKDGSKKKYIYYRCPSEEMGKRHFKKVNEDHLEEMFLRNIKPLAEKYIFEARLKPEKVEKKGEDIKELLDEIDRLNYSFRKKRISVTEYDREYEQLEKRLAKAQKEAPKEKDITGIEAFLNSGWENVYKNLSREDKRALIRSVVKSMTFDDNGELVVDFI
jgi:DNA invertase Pin-like site-specific DNA recombinase